MADRTPPRPDDETGIEENPLGIGPRDAESSNTGSTADTSYNAHGSDPYTTGGPVKDQKRPGGAADRKAKGSDRDESR